MIIEQKEREINEWRLRFVELEREVSDIGTNEVKIEQLVTENQRLTAIAEGNKSHWEFWKEGTLNYKQKCKFCS